MVIEIRNLTKHIGTIPVIQEISLKVNKGQVFALLGPNGAGKTTLIRLLLGLLKPEAGQIILFGKHLDDSNRVNLLHRIGVQNDGNLYENITAKENLQIWGSIYGMNKQKIEERIQEMCEVFQFEQYLNEKVACLSKGNKQKILLARAFLHEPELLVLDEPTSGLDPVSIDEFYCILKKLKAKGTTIIMCTHHLYGIDDVIDSFSIIKQGSFLLSGNLAGLKNREKLVRLRGNFSEKAKKTVTSIGQVTSFSVEEILFKVTSYERIPLLIESLVRDGTKIDEVYRVEEKLKDIYFRVINGGSL